MKVVPSMPFLRSAAWPLAGAALLALFLALPALAFDPAALPDPKQTGGGWLCDPDHVLVDSEARAIQAACTSLEADTGVELAVVVVESIGGGSVKEAATALFNHWGVGKAATNDGVLFLLVRDARRMEVEVGRGLETSFPTATIEALLQRSVVPHLRAGQTSAGIRSGTEALALALRELATSRPATGVGRSPAGTGAAAVEAVGVGAVEPPDDGAAGSASDPAPEPLAQGPAQVPRHLSPLWQALALCELSAVGFAILALVLLPFSGAPFQEPDSVTVTGRMAAWLAAVSLALAIVGAASVSTGAALLCGGLAATALLAALPTSGWVDPGDYSDRLTLLSGGTQSLAAAGFTAAAVCALSVLAGTSLPFDAREAQTPWAWLGPAGFGGGWAILRRSMRRVPPRCPRCSLLMHLLTEEQDDAHLEPGKRREESLGSVDYDVWLCGECELTEIRRYRSLFSSYGSCSSCGFVTAESTSRTLVSPSYSSCGRGETTTRCRNCGASYTREYTIAQLQHSTSGSGSSGYRSSSSSWGGGSSSGRGGGGASW